MQPKERSKKICLERSAAKTLLTLHRHTGKSKDKHEAAGTLLDLSSESVVSAEEAEIEDLQEMERQIIKVAQKRHGNFNLLTAISILLTAISIYSRQFQFTHGNFNFTYGNFNLLAAIPIYSRQFQFYLRQFQFTHGNFNLFTAISIYSLHGNFNFFTATLTAFFASLTTCQLRRPTVATKSQNAKIKSRVLKSIFKVKSENQKLKVDSRTLMPVDSEQTTEEFTGPRKL